MFTSFNNGARSACLQVYDCMFEGICQQCCSMSCAYIHTNMRACMHAYTRTQGHAYVGSVHTIIYTCMHASTHAYIISWRTHLHICSGRPWSASCLQRREAKQTNTRQITIVDKGFNVVLRCACSTHVVAN